MPLLPLSITSPRGTSGTSPGRSSSLVRWASRIVSPVCRVAASTRAATLTASPITVNSNRPAPPTLPATTSPEFSPIPTRNAPAAPDRTVLSMPSAAASAWLAWSA